MIAFVDHTCINQEVMTYTPFKVYNMSSLLELGIRLNNLIPPIYNPDGSLMDFRDERQFDQWYANYLMSNNAAFVDMMSIVYDLYNGINVLVLIGHDDYKDIITESFIKFIQQRYGYNSNLLNDYNDWYYSRFGQSICASEDTLRIWQARIVDKTVRIAIYYGCFSV